MGLFRRPPSIHLSMSTSILKDRKAEAVPVTSQSSAVALLEAIAKLLPGIAILIALSLFHNDMSQLLGRTKSFKGAGLEFEIFESNAKEASLAIRKKALQDLPTSAPTSYGNSMIDQPSPLLKVAWKKLREMGPSLGSIKILWVDDHPENNFALRRNLASYGVQIEIATNNEAAINLMLMRDYDLIISDVGRDNGPETKEHLNERFSGGIGIAEWISQVKYEAPVLFYTFTPNRVPSTVPHVIATASPSILLNTVADLISGMLTEANFKASTQKN